jgi:DNA replication ATP-dependent helicase Dna2
MKLMNFGISPKDITLITTFNKERANLFDKLHNNDVEVLTIDKSQGLDRDCVVVLCGTRDGVRDDRELLNSMRRVNVAFTRARKK